ncbi:extracellular solute-binding protein [Reyranella sp.]|uniref:extracellular solute-binding protein n=1 Tax=Reyranella sp. TaxID=1929291 RepID=UPI00378349F2
MFRRTFIGAVPLTLLAAPLAAQASKKLVVYTSNDSTLNDLVFGDFRKETGIEVEPVAAGSGVVMRRLQAEKARPLGDIVWGVSRSLLQTNKALFEPYASKNIDATPAEFRDPDNLWIGNNLHLLVILQNTRMLPAADGPKSWADLLDPKWKGKIAFTDPANSGSAYATVTMLVDLWGGGDAGWKKVGDLFRNMKVLNRSSLVFQGVGNGEYPLGISLEYAGPLWAAGGAPVKVVYPSDGTTASMEGVAVIKGGPNTENARIFVDYINRKAVREMILKATFRRPTRNDLDLSSLPGGLPPLSQVKLVNYDEEGWTEKRAKTLEKIKDVIQDSR